MQQVYEWRKEKGRIHEVLVLVPCPEPAPAPAQAPPAVAQHPPSQEEPDLGLAAGTTGASASERAPETTSKVRGVVSAALRTTNGTPAPRHASLMCAARVGSTGARSSSCPVSREQRRVAGGARCC